VKPSSEKPGRREKERNILVRQNVISDTEEDKSTYREQEEEDKIIFIHLYSPLSPENNLCIYFAKFIYLSSREKFA